MADETEQENESMRDEEEVERAIPQTLALSHKMNMLFNFQTAIDQNLNFLVITRNIVPTFSALKQSVESQTKREFKVSHFQQIISVAPFFYNHKWELRQGKYELVITLPKNSEAIVKDQNVRPSEDSYSGRINGDLMQQRAQLFKKLLLELLVQDYQFFRSQMGQDGDDIYDLREWPEDFDLNDTEFVQNIPLAELKPQPVK